MFSEELFSIMPIKTRTISPESPTGEKGKAAMAEPLENSPGEKLGKGWKSRPFVTIAPGEKFTLADISGEGVIKSIWITGEVDQGLIIRMYWDKSNMPSVECPLTDFFLYGWARPHLMENWNEGPNYTVNSQLMCVNPNRGLNSFIPMPYRDGALLTLENRSSESKGVYYQINFEERELPQDAGYFHAVYSPSVPVKYKEVHTLLDNVSGSGVYLGTALYVGLNRTSQWWGEGEFKFYIDGDDEFPTICSTGLEDYFGGAFNWDIEGNYTTYSTPYLGMHHVERPDGLYNIQQKFSMYRWHVTDPIRFEENLRVTVQCLGWQTMDNGKIKHFLPRQDDYISVSYFYLDKPSKTMPSIISHDELTKHF